MPSKSFDPADFFFLSPAFSLWFLLPFGKFCWSISFKLFCKRSRSSLRLVFVFFTYFWMFFFCVLLGHTAVTVHCWGTYTHFLLRSQGWNYRAASCAKWFFSPFHFVSLRGMVMVLVVRYKTAGTTLWFQFRIGNRAPKWSYRKHEGKHKTKHKAFSSLRDRCDFSSFSVKPNNIHTHSHK